MRQAGKTKKPKIGAQGATASEERWSFALESAGVGVWDVDLVSGRCYYSRIWKAMLGYGEDELGDDSDLWLKLVHPDDRERAIESGKAHEEGLVPFIETEFRLRHKDGHWIWVLDRGKIIERDQNGKPTRMIGAQTDITKQKQAEQHLALLNERIRLAVEAGGIGLWHWDIDAQKLHWDLRMHDIYGTDARTFSGTGKDWTDRLHPDDRVRALHQSELAVKECKVLSSEYRIIRTDGQIRHVRTLARVITSGSRMLVGTESDITEHVVAAQALAAEKERLRITLQSIGDAVICTGTDDRINFMNNAAETLLQRTQSELLGAPLRAHFCPSDDETGAPLASSTQVAMRELRSVEHEQHGRLDRADGSMRSVREIASPVIASTGEIVGSVLVIQDNTAARALQRELAHAATHDRLTGLKSRSAFEGELGEALDNARQEAGSHALLYIDLDRFKIINDTAGHAAGDTLLKNVSALLRSIVPAEHVVARLGGDEFAVLLRKTSVGAAEKIATRILTAISSERFPWAGKIHEIGASIGLAIIDRDSTDPEAVMAHADVACYAAKAAGRNRLSIYRADAGDAQRHMAELHVASGIREAIGENRFRLYAQEIRDLAAPLRRGRHLEILTRMTAPDGSLIPPGAFIPAAERFDLMGALDRWVLHATLDEFGQDIMAVPDLSVAVNLSANSLSDPELWTFVGSELRRSGFDARRLVFEITETAVINNFAAAERFVANARAVGCRISLDDFGSGVSSFTYLKRFAVDFIKIDGAFVKHMHESQYDKAIVRVIAGIAKEIGVKVIAECVEWTDTVEILTSLGIGYGQGYLFHRPRPLAEVIESYEPAQVAPQQKRKFRS